MATFKEALDYAAKNPNSEFATMFGKEVATGKHDSEAKSLGFDTTPIKQKYTQPVVVQPKAKEKDTFMEKVAGFTGGKKIAQGLGQAIVNPEILKQQTEIQKGDIDLQGKLVQQIKSFKEQGKDTSRLEGALSDLTSKMGEDSSNLGELLNQKDLTTKQVLGSALQLGGTVIGAGTVGSGASAVSKATTAGQGAMAGLKAGATSGAIYGGASGVATGLQEDGNATEIAQKGITGALTGAALGGALGATGGAITGKIKGAKAAKAVKKEEGLLDLVSPKQTTDYKIQAQKEGRVTNAGLLKSAKILPSKTDRKLVEVVKDVVNPDFTPQQNINLLSKKVDDINTGVKAYVEKNKTPFNTAQLSKKLNKGKEELNLIFAGDKQADKTYNAVVKEFLRNVEGKDTKGLLDARQKFDKIPAIKKLLESEGLGENTKKQIVKEVRRAANEYISELLPKGNQYKDALLNETRMIDVMDNIAEKNIDRIGRNKIQYLVKKYPWLKTAGYIGLGAVGAQLGIGAIGAATGKGE
jgi:hypothetical protein